VIEKEVMRKLLEVDDLFRDEGSLTVGIKKRRTVDGGVLGEGGG